MYIYSPGHRYRVLVDVHVASTFDGDWQVASYLVIFRHVQLQPPIPRHTYTSIYYNLYSLLYTDISRVLVCFFYICHQVQRQPLHAPTPCILQGILSLVHRYIQGADR